ncbi:Hypp9181 [Branchiostoma lanceolatum]|uniref:Hypp9181 protein n=1 Tax=Branchiostoma lanceolatum TaxID=7740 RepID=A0A8K0EHQ2_BRALA|nr:Hypp9181 [Branchiostoma lanceolatum]
MGSTREPSVLIRSDTFVATNMGPTLETPIGTDTSISSTLTHRELEEWCESTEQECRGLYHDLKETMGESKKSLRESELKFSRVAQEKSRLQKERDNALAKVQALKDEAVSKDHKASERLSQLQERLVMKSKECEELQKANVTMDRKMKAEKIKHGRNMAKLQDDMAKLRNVNKRLVDDCDNSKKLALEALKQAENAERFRQDEMRKRTQMEERMQFLIREKEVLSKKRYMTDKAYHEAVRRMAHVISEKEEITLERNKERAMRTQLERAFDQKNKNTESSKETMNEMKKRALDRLNKSHIPTVNNAKHVSATEEMRKKFLGAMATQD